MSRNAYVSREARCIKETDRAILVETQFGRAWIPRTCVSDRSGVWEKGDNGELVIQRWLVERKRALRQR